MNNQPTSTVTEDQMNSELHCDVCNTRIGSLGVCYGCAMAMNAVRELVDSLQMVYNGAWEVSINGEDYFIVNLIVFKSDGDERTAECVENSGDPAQVVAFFEALRNGTRND